MRTVTFEVAPKNAKFKLFVNGVALKLKNGAGRKDCKEEVKHIAQWYVVANPFTQYSVQITKPEEAKFLHEGTIDNEMKDEGSEYFRVNKG